MQDTTAQEGWTAPNQATALQATSPMKQPLTRAPVAVETTQALEASVQKGFTAQKAATRLSSARQALIATTKGQKYAVCAWRATTAHYVPPATF